MSSEIMDAEQAHTCNETCDFRKFSNWFKPRATALVKEHMELESPAFVRAEEVDLFQTFIKSFDTPELKQEHDCTACLQFLKGIATFGLIKELNFGLTIIPFALPYLDDAFEQEVPEIYRKPYHNVLTAFKNATHTILKATDVIEMGDYFGTEEAGGWSHLSLNYTEIKRAKLKDYFNKVLPNPTGYGLGRSEIVATQEWIDICYKAFDNSIIPSSELLSRDHPTLDEINKVVEYTLNQNRTLAVKLLLINNGLRFLQLRKTTVGTIIESLAKGNTLIEALREYSKYTDPRNYMRPTRMPTSVEFERSVAFLSENGYAEYMPMRLATWQDLEEHQMLNWIKAERVAEEVTKPTDIFAKQRQKVTAPVTPAKSPAVILPTRQCSMHSLLNDVLSKPELIEEVLFTPPKLHWGSFAISHKTEGNNLFADGKMIRAFTGVNPINHYELPRIVKVPSHLVSGYRIWDADEDSVGGVHFIFKDATWTIPLPPPLFAHTLSPELREHRRTIEDWCRLNQMNVDELEKVIEYEKALFAIPMSLGQSVTITFKDNTKRRFDVMTAR